jgi:hypothetical protein
MMYQNAIDSATQSDMSRSAWNEYLDNYFQSLKRLERQVDDAYDLREICTDEWCEVNECMLDEITNAVFAIHEPHWLSNEDSRKLKDLKKKIHDLHAQKKGSAH